MTSCQPTDCDDDDIMENETGVTSMLNRVFALKQHAIRVTITASKLFNMKYQYRCAVVSAVGRGDPAKDFTHSAQNSCTLILLCILYAQSSGLIN